MKALDTNILLRALLADEPSQQVEAAITLLKSTSTGERLFVSAFVLLECAWVLKNKGRSQIEIANALEKIVNANGVVVSLKSAILTGLIRFRTAPAGVGIADCFILADAESNDARPLMTFDCALNAAESSRTQIPRL